MGMGRLVNIYQTLENKGTDEEIRSHGPFFSSNFDDQGRRRLGVKIPWFGPGYYFWDTYIEDAHWWGRVAKNNDYVIYGSSYDLHSPYVLDFTENSQRKDIDDCARLICEKLLPPGAKLTFPLLLAYLRKMNDNQIKAVRIQPEPCRNKQPEKTPYLVMP